MKYSSELEEQAGSRTGFRMAVYLEGVSNGTLHLSYREFKDDFARPAFTQDLEFGLAPTYPQEITFKSIHVRLVSADGNGVRYVVSK